MKKILLLNISIFICAGLWSQIPNPGFENWSIHSLNAPSSWQFVLGKVSKVTPGHAGSFAAKLEADTIIGNPGVVLYGYSNNGQDFTGGIPCPYKPDSVKGYFKYSITAGDSANILVILKKNGNILAFNWFPIKGSHTANFIRLQFKIDYTDNVTTPDSLILGIASTLGKTDHNKGYIIVDDISLTKINFTVPNGNFESWGARNYDEADGWESMDYEAFLRDAPLPLTKTTDSHQGTYAALIQNFIIGQDTVYGVISTGKIDSWFTPGFPVTEKPDFLKGYYKFIPQNGDSMIIAVQLFYNGIPIGQGSFTKGETVASYQPFTVDINYGGPFTPDSATIIIASFFGDKNGRPHGNSKLYIDALELGTNTGTTNILPIHGNSFNVYPNPVNKSSVVSYQLSENSNVILELYNMAGQRLRTIIDSRQNNGSYTLDLNRDNLAPGIYELKLVTDNNTLNRKIVVE
jgi:hypothetical protein